MTDAFFKKRELRVYDVYRESNHDRKRQARSYRYKHLAVEHFFLALDIWRKCPLPRVSRGHFSKVYRWINVAKTYKFFSDAAPPNPQFFTPQLVMKLINLILNIYHCLLIQEKS